MFLERKICKAIYGKAFQDLHAQIGLNDLQKSVDRFGPDHPHTCLCPRLKGIDPDDAFSSVPYEKGSSPFAQRVHTHTHTHAQLRAKRIKAESSELIFCSSLCCAGLLCCVQGSTS